VQGFLSESQRLMSSCCQIVITGSCPLRWPTTCSCCPRHSGADVIWPGINCNDRRPDGDWGLESHTWCREEPGRLAGSRVFWGRLCTQLPGILPQVLGHQPLVCIGRNTCNDNTCTA